MTKEFQRFRAFLVGFDIKALLWNAKRVEEDYGEQVLIMEAAALEKLKFVKIIFVGKQFLEHFVCRSFEVKLSFSLMNITAKNYSWI